VEAALGAEETGAGGEGVMTGGGLVSTGYFS